MKKQTLVLAFILSTISSFVFGQNNGNVGIGTTTPTARLQVNASSSGTKPSLLILDSLNGLGPTLKFQRLGLESAFSLTAGFGNTEAGRGMIISWIDDSLLWIKDDGRMGLGTGNPQGRMHINHKSSSGNPSFLILDSTGGTGNGISFRKQASNREFVIVSDGMNMYFNPKEIGIDKSVPWAFLGTGQTGFGTTTPLGKVQLNNNSSALRPALVLLDSTTGNGNMLAFRKQGSDKQFRMRTDLGGQELELFSLDYSAGGVTHEDTWSTSRFSMRSNGNIGISTTTPAGRLQINNKSGSLNPSFLILDSTGGTGNGISFRKQASNREFVIVSDGMNMYFNPKEVGLDKSVPWAFLGTGQTGFGTTTPLGKVQLNNNSSALRPAFVLLDSTTGNGNMLAFRKQGSDKQFRMRMDLGGQDLELFSLDYSQGGVTHEDTWSTSGFAMRSNGNIGIGTTTPRGRLQINTKTTASNPAQILIDSAGGIGNMLAFRKQGVNRQFTIKTELGGQDLGLFSINNSVTGIEFTDEWSTQVFTISEKSNVGIGTGIAEGRLQINHNSTNIQPAMLLMDSSNGSGNMITFRKQGINKQFRINSNLAPLHQDASLAIGVHNDGDPFASILTMKGDGKVGINNNNPASALDVTGDLNVTGRLRMGGAPGVAGQVLTSNGPGQAPSWQPANAPVGFSAATTPFNVPAAAIIIPTSFSVERFDLMGNFNVVSGEFVAPVVSQYALNAHVAFNTPPAGNLPQYTIKVVIETLNGENVPVQVLEQAVPLPTNMPAQTIHVSLHSIQLLQTGQKVRLKVLHTRPDGPVLAKVEEFSASKI